MRLRAIAVLPALVVTATASSAQVRISPADSALARSIMAELVAIPSVSGTRGTVTAAQAVVARLRAAGFSEADAFVTGEVDSIGGVVARLRGRTQGKPILLMGHLDVVPAAREDWTTDPFTLTEKDGFWYGRGVIDNKDAVTAIVTNFIRWKRGGYVPERDIVAVITGDEETSGNQSRWFASGEGRRHIGDPLLAGNLDVGGGWITDNGQAILNVQTAEKVYMSYRLTVRNRGGHSASPRSDNAIYSLASALTRIAAFKFPVEVTPTTRITLERSAAVVPDSIARLLRAVASEPVDTAAATRLAAIGGFNWLRTTCVATRLSAGHADNALPQTAQATVNCRIMPGTDTASVAGALRAVVADTSVNFEEVQPASLSPASPLTPELLNLFERVASRFWPGVVVIPEMSSGATDGAFMRAAGIPVYGISGIFIGSETGAHGRDERVDIARFYKGLEYGKAIAEALAAMK
ncbi:MAG: M20/M25/M40 family metallo-hydrolase [Gemmatimonadaceae bacterium]